MPDRSASLYRRNNKLIICANAEVTEGYRIDHEPFVLLEEPVSAADVGRAVREMLAQFRAGTQSDGGGGENSNGGGDEFLSYFATLAGVDTYRAFMQGALYCGIEERDGRIAFQPMKNDDGGFDELGAITPIACEANHEALGRTALEALGRSR